MLRRLTSLFGGQQPPSAPQQPADDDPLAQAVRALMLVQPIEETRKAVHAWQHIMLSDSFEHLLGFLLQQAKGRGDAEAVGLIADRQDLIASCRDIGVDPTFDLLAFVLGNPQALNQIVVSFINAPTWSETKRLVEAQRQTLLSVFADQFIAHLLAQYPLNTPQHPRLQEHRELLARCRREGIEAAFADRLPPPVPATVTPELVDQLLATSSQTERDTFLAQHPELEQVLERLQHFEALMRQAQQLNQLQELSQKAELLRAALTLADESRWRAGSAMAHFELGRAYTEPQLGDQDAAIAHFEAALEMYTREQSPKEWGNVQNNLGIVYFQRGDGDRRDNLRRAITHFEAALEVRDRQAAPFDWAQTQQNLGAIYANYTFENPAEQIERAIAYYQAALEVYTHEVLPADWARTQFNLGLAFGDRQAGDRAENIEQALVCLQQALGIHTRQADPISWALGQAELGRMYSRRIRGDQAENIERAIDCLSRAVEVYTREAFPLEWAKTQERLGQAYRQRIAGGLADSFDQASACLRRALEVYTASAAPARHASLQFDLMSVYAERLQAVRADALGAAIVSLVNTRSADTLKQLAAADRELLLTAEAAQALAGLASDARAQGDEEAALLLEEHHGLLIQQRGPAMAALLDEINASRESTDYARRAQLCRTGLRLVDRARPAGADIWAYLHSALGDALSREWAGDRAENLEQAVEHFQRALEQFTREAKPQEWADTQLRLAVVYGDRVRGDRAQNRDLAIRHNTQALEVYTRADSPERWAAVQANLGGNYHQRLQGNPAENLEQAIGHCQQALEIYTSAAFPEE